MSESPRPPVAVRIVRPYASEDELLENELETIGKTSVILIGAHARPTGVILRFELSLASGAAALRGEGRVLGHKEAAFRGQPGLALRFTRLDPKSKALVDRATAMREARAMGGSAAVAFVPPAPGSEPRASAPPPPSRAPLETTPDIPDVAMQTPQHTTRPSTRPSRTPAPHSVQTTPSRPPGRPSTTPARTSTRPPDPALARALTEDTPAPGPTRGRPSQAPGRPSSVPGARTTNAPGRPSEAPRAPASSAPTFAPGRAAVPELDLQTPRPPMPTESEPVMAPELTAALLSSAPPPPPGPSTEIPGNEAVAAPRPAAAAVAPPSPDAREAALARLRERARGLSAEAVAEILARRPR